MARLIGSAVCTVILLLALACWWQGATIKDLRADLVAAEQDVAALQAASVAKDKAFADLRKELAARDAALAERERQAAEIENQRRAALRALKEATRDDRQTTDWADTPVPDTVRGLLR